MEGISVFHFVLVWTLFLTATPAHNANNFRNNENKKITPVITSTQNVKEELKLNPNITYKLDDVQVPHYGSNPCNYFDPPMPDFRAPGRRISEVKCFEHVWNLKYNQQEYYRDIECLKYKHRRRLVTGGSDTEAGQYAHMAAIGWKAQVGKWIFKCGASIISSKFLLTAAHCSRVSSRDVSVTDPYPKIVRLGGHSISDYDIDGVPATDMEIKSFISHELYRAPRKYYDIALIEMVRDVRFEWMIHPACLGTTFELSTNVPATVTGWGVVELATLRTAPILQVAELDLMASTECDTRLTFGQSRNWRGLVEHQLCAGHMAGGVDTCMGDSGGPIQEKLNISQVVPEGNPWYLHRVLGVTSFGFGCAKANTPAVYSRVASFIDWIEGKVWPEFV